MKKNQPKRSKSSARVGSRDVVNPLVGAFAVRMTDWRMEAGLTLKTVAADTGLSIAII